MIKKEKKIINSLKQKKIRKLKLTFEFYYIQTKIYKTKQEKYPTQKRMNSNQRQISMDDLVYNIETKISLLSQIQQNMGLLKNNKNNNHHNNNKKDQSNMTIENTNNNINNEQHFQQFQQEINLPMQILNKKMMEILNTNNNNNNNNQRNIQDNYDSKYERTLDKKKRMDLNQLQTGTRNIDEMKRRQTENRSGIKIRHLYHNQHQGVRYQQQMNVKEFKQNNQSELYSMTQSIMNSSHKSSSSRIINKFNSIQLNYMDKIKSLTFKVSFLQQRLQQSQQEKHDLIGSLETYKSLYTRKQAQIDKQVQHKLQEIKSSLIEKFAEQCRLKYNQYISQLKQITNLLNEEKKRRKFYEEQNKVLKLQKDNYQHMYKSLLKKQKQYLKIDIDRTRNQLNDIGGNNHVEMSQQNMYMSANSNNNDNNIESEYSQIENKHYPDSMIFQKQPLVKGSNYFIQQKQSTLSIKKTQKSKSKSKNNSIVDKNKSFSEKNRQSSSLSKDKQSKKNVSIQKEKQSKTKTKRKSKSKSNNQQIQMKQEMTKQQLIPFLAKGIQQLKQRLQMK